MFPVFRSNISCNTEKCYQDIQNDMPLTRASLKQCYDSSLCKMRKSSLNTRVFHVILKLYIEGSNEKLVEWTTRDYGY